MRYQLLKLLFLGVLFLGQSALAIDTPSVKQFSLNASEKADSLYNEAQYFYLKKEYRKAIPLYEESYKYKPSKDIPANTGISYKHINDYHNAMKWYNIGINRFNDIKSIFNLALLYEENINDIPSAIKYYKIAITKENLDAYDNISLIYHDIKKDNLTASAYYIATIDKSYTKKEILDFLRNDWKIDEPTLKKAYELQKTLVPNPYTGGID